MNTSDITHLASMAKRGADELADSTQRAIETGAAKASEAVNDGVGSVKRVIDRAGRAASRSADELADQAAPAASRARDWFNTNAEATRDAVQRAQRRGNDLAEQCQHYVEANPGKSIALAAGAAALLAMLWHGHQRRSAL